MMRFFILFLTLLLQLTPFSQIHLNGTWKGYILKDGLSIEKAQPVYLELEISKSVVNGYQRQEIYESTHFAIKKILQALAFQPNRRHYSM